MSIKAILLDIDGTLTNSEKVISSQTRDALIRAEKAGIRLVIASGRPALGLDRFGDVLQMKEHDGLYCCYNGARVVNCRTRDVLFDKPLSPDQAKDVLKHIRKFKVRPMIAKDEYMYVNDVFDCFIQVDGKPFNVMEYEARGNGYLLCEKKDMAAFCDFPVSKILTFGDPDYLRAHWQELSAPFKDTLNSMFTASWYFEFTAKEVDKAKAMSCVLTALGIKREEIMAFGDEQNDVSMLSWAGVGVAMGNASQAAKAAADEITLSNDEDGIAQSLYRHMPEIFR